MFRNVPMTIPYKGELLLRGEAVISYDDFEKTSDYGVIPVKETYLRKNIAPAIGLIWNL